MIDSQGDEMSLDQIALFNADLSRCSATIQNWKRHQLRSVQQDRARDYVLEQLDDCSVFIVMDWAMKWLETKYREKQSDWFGKKGLPWHLMVIIRKQKDRADKVTTETSKSFEHRTMCHIFDHCKQDAMSIVSILEDALRRLKMDDPKLQFAYLRSDNGSCYHSAITTTCISEIFTRTGILIRRIDFSEPQAGKGPCDRRAATIKGEVRRYIDEKHNCTTSKEFVEAAKSTKNLSIFAGQLNNNENVSSTIKSSNKSSKTKWPGISSIFNIEYECLPVDSMHSSSNNHPHVKVNIIAHSLLDQQSAVLILLIKLIDLFLSGTRSHFTQIFNDQYGEFSLCDRFSSSLIASVLHCPIKETC